VNAEGRVVREAGREGISRPLFTVTFGSPLLPTDMAYVEWWCPEARPFLKALGDTEEHSDWCG
jgi:hypothetical protein